LSLKFLQHFPLTAKLATINALLAVSLGVLVAFAWRQLPSGAQTAEIVVLGRAQRATQNADMMHDALHSDVLTALLASNSQAADRDKINLSIRNNAREFRSDFEELARLDLSADLRPRLAFAENAGREYVEFAERLTQTAFYEPEVATRLRPDFDASFELTKSALAAQTTLIAQHLDTANGKAQQAVADARMWLLVAGVSMIGIAWLLVALIARSIRRSLMSVAGNARKIANGELNVRNDFRGSDEVGQIAGAVDQMAEALSKMIVQMRDEATHNKFLAQLTRGLDMADGERQAYEVVRTAMQHISPQTPMELLLADSSEAHFQLAAQHPTAGAPGCSVDSPFACIAVRRGRALTFDSNASLDACPKLRDRGTGELSATCVPVMFMGRALGVLHACSPAATPLSHEAAELLKSLGPQVGARIGTVRAFQRTQLQAQTDALTGLANRRTAEKRIRDFMNNEKPFAFVMADLDRFKLLNDTYGHQAGDDALRLFSDVALNSIKEGDLASRWGGEEFCFLLADCDANQALQWIEGVQARLADEFLRRSVPSFTASFGVADSTMGLLPDGLVGAADMALYRAKSGGRNRGVALQPDEVVPQGTAYRSIDITGEIDVRGLQNVG
jgi:diguanylate cyclase (GGDEF)-like protein